MAKIPVGATIARAYRFAFADFLKILGVVWLPWAIMSAGGFLVMRRALALSTAMTARDFSAIGPALGYLVPFYLVMFILLSMQTIGITQLALGLRQGPAWIYFSLGRPLWRLIGSFLLLAIALIMGYFIVILASLLFGIVAAALAKLISVAAVGIIFAAIAGIAIVALWCGYIYSFVRLTFLLTPVIAANEEGFALERAWALGKGNFWRMFAILLAVLVPFLILECVFVFGFLWHGLPPMPPLHATAEQTAAFVTTMQAQNAAMVAHMYDNWYLVFPLGGLLTILFYGLSAGAQSFAYQAASRPDEALNLLSDLR